MGVKIVSETANKYNEQFAPETPNEVYADLNANQFKHFAKLHLKDAIMDKDKNVRMMNVDTDITFLSNLNMFFENIPDYLLDFSTEASRKLIMMYLTSNLEYNFGMILGENEYTNLYRAVMRIHEVDPTSPK